MANIQSRMEAKFLKSQCMCFRTRCSLHETQEPAIFLALLGYIHLCAGLMQFHPIPKQQGGMIHEARHAKPCSCPCWHAKTCPYLSKSQDSSRAFSNAVVYFQPVQWLRVHNFVTSMHCGICTAIRRPQRWRCREVCLAVYLVKHFHTVLI